MRVRVDRTEVLLNISFKFLNRYQLFPMVKAKLQLLNLRQKRTLLHALAAMEISWLQIATET